MKNIDVDVKYISLKGREIIAHGELLGLDMVGVNIKVKLYMPNDGYYILCVAYDRVIEVLHNKKNIYPELLK